MRDPHTGAFGVVGLVCVVALKIAAIDALPSAIRPQLLVLAPGLGRWSIVALATAFPYGRPHGLGAPLKASATPRALGLASLLPIAACLAAGLVGTACGLLTIVAALALGRWLMRLLPGLTGDCYGAVCEITETLVWLCAAPLARGLA
jgi:adenosylcobinamide-GDP ribazoletransferase